jgi:hypothetical protein
MFRAIVGLIFLAGLTAASSPTVTVQCQACDSAVLAKIESAFEAQGWTVNVVPFKTAADIDADVANGVVLPMPIRDYSPEMMKAAQSRGDAAMTAHILAMGRQHLAALLKRHHWTYRGIRCTKAACDLLEVAGVRPKELDLNGKPTRRNDLDGQPPGFELVTVGH